MAEPFHHAVDSGDLETVSQEVNIRCGKLLELFAANEEAQDHVFFTVVSPLQHALDEYTRRVVQLNRALDQERYGDQGDPEAVQRKAVANADHYQKSMQIAASDLQVAVSAFEAAAADARDQRWWDDVWEGAVIGVLSVLGVGALGLGYWIVDRRQ